MSTLVTCTLIDELLEPWRAAMGEAMPAYRNHCQRIYGLTLAYHGDASDSDARLVAAAAAFHDIGIWSHGTFDYLEPSARLAKAWLGEDGSADEQASLRGMVMEHHKIRPADGPLVEAFRRADWCDVTMGQLRFGLEKWQYRDLVDAFPYLGFHSLLLKLGTKQLLQHPLNPMPMMRW